MSEASLILKAAACKANVLLVGESGVGKRFLARKIHEASQFASGRFDMLFCMPDEEGAADPADLLVPLESQHGTVYVRGIDLLGPRGQRNMLVYLDGRESEARSRRGPVRNRLIFSSQKDLRIESRRGRFMQQLYLRASVITLDVPPLRCRRGDVIVALAEQFVRGFATYEGKRVGELSAAARAFLKRQAWEGNVRELKNAMNRAVVMAEVGQPIDAELLEGVTAEPVT